MDSLCTKHTGGAIFFLLLMHFHHERHKQTCIGVVTGYRKTIQKAR
jgi:hypothetical protein